MENNHLHVLWTSSDPITAEHMLLLYTVNSLKREWWEKVTIIIWGGSMKLIAEDSNIQRLIKEAVAQGVKFLGCLHCAQQVKAEDILTDLGVELKYMGEGLTEIIKTKEHLITI